MYVCVLEIDALTLFCCTLALLLFSDSTSVTMNDDSYKTPQ